MAPCVRRAQVAIARLQRHGAKANRLHSQLLRNAWDEANELRDVLRSWGAAADRVRVVPPVGGGVGATTGVSEFSGTSDVAARKRQRIAASDDMEVERGGHEDDAEVEEVDSEVDSEVEVGTGVGEQPAPGEVEGVRRRGATRDTPPSLSPEKVLNFHRPGPTARPAEHPRLAPAVMDPLPDERLGGRVVSPTHFAVVVVVPRRGLVRVSLSVPCM
jgi:hypothetical protein